MKPRKPAAVHSADPRKPAVMAAFKAKYNCRKVTSVKHDRDRGVFLASVMNFDTPLDALYAHGKWHMDGYKVVFDMPPGEEREGGVFVLESDI